MAMFEANKLGWVAPLATFGCNQQTGASSSVYSSAFGFRTFGILMLTDGEKEREMLTDWILGGGGSASKSSSREKLEYLVCHVFSFVPTFGRQASQWKVVDLVRFLRFMSMRMQPNAHSPKSQTQVLVFCFFWRHHLFMHIFFKQTSRSHGSLYRSFFQPSKYHRIGLENLQETPIFDGKNIKNHGFRRFALFANPLKIWVA